MLFKGRNATSTARLSFGKSPLNKTREGNFQDWMCPRNTLLILTQQQNKKTNIFLCHEGEMCNLPLEIFRSVGRLVALWNDTVLDFRLPEECLEVKGCSGFGFWDVLYIIALLVLMLGSGSASMWWWFPPLVLDSTLPPVPLRVAPGVGGASAIAPSVVTQSLDHGLDNSTACLTVSTPTESSIPCPRSCKISPHQNPVDLPSIGRIYKPRWCDVIRTGASTHRVASL